MIYAEDPRTPGMAWVPAATPGGSETLVPLAQIEREPPMCSISHPYGSDRAQCLTCQRRVAWVRRSVQAEEDDRLTASASSLRVSGSFLRDLPSVAPIWGTSELLLASEGQGWMIVGPDGTGKTSAACQYVKARLGVGGPSMWDLPVQPLAPDRSVYYFAADRPRQMMEAFKRGLDPEDDALWEQLDRRLIVHRGPPPFRLSREQGRAWLMGEVVETSAGMVVLDSRKDFGSTLDAEQVSGLAETVQVLVADGVEVLILAHPVKGRRNGPPSLEDVSGHREVFSGLGSVVFLDGRPGSPVVGVHHVKPIHEVVPSFSIQHDHASGHSERLPEGLVVEGGVLSEGRSPVDSFEVRVLAALDAHPSGEAPATSLKEVLKTDNLSRDLRGLLRAGVIEHNGKRGAQSGYRRGPKAPPAT